MANPEYLLFDADALIQVFRSRTLRSNQRAFLGRFRDHYRVQPAVVPEVESEVRFHPKFKRQFEQDMQRLYDSGHLAVVERGLIRRLLQTRQVSPAQIDETIRACADRSRRYSSRVDQGEAYMHAVAVELCLPAVSNDVQAINGLEAHGLPTAAPVLRLFDCLCFLVSDGTFTEADCERVRDELRELGEYVPRAFDSHEPYPSCDQQFLGLRQKV